MDNINLIMLTISTLKNNKKINKGLRAEAWTLFALRQTQV